MFIDKDTRKPVDFRPDPRTPYVFLHRGRQYVLTVCGARFFADAYASHVLEHELREEWWEIEPGQVVFDIGSAFGSYTLPSLASGALCVVAMDPDRDTYFSLASNLAVNGFWNRCAHLNIMAGDSERMADYYPANNSERPEGPAELRMMLPIDSIRRRVVPWIDRLDWMKIDVEGSEAAVIKGAIGTIGEFHPRLLVENHLGFNPQAVEDVQALLLPLGYAEEQRSDDDGANNCWSRWTWEGKTPPQGAPKGRGCSEVAGKPAT